MTLPQLNPNPIYVMASCIENEIESFDKRYFKATPDFVPGQIDWDFVLRIVDWIIDRMCEIKFEPFDMESFLNEKKGKLGVRYMTAVNKLVRDGFDPIKDTSVGAFIKNEKYYELKAPRFIMGRNPIFNVLYAPYVTPVEKVFFQLEQVCNACNYDECGAKFDSISDSPFGFWVNDFRKFESSQQEWCDQLFFYFMSKYLRRVDGAYNFDEHFRLYVLACVAKGHTPSGLGFILWYMTKSGELTTGLKNGFLNLVTTIYTMCYNFCEHKTKCPLQGCKCGFEKCRVKGDDSYNVWLKDIKVDDFVNCYSWFGFDAEIERRRFWWNVDFCSGYFVPSNGSFTYIQRLDKLLDSLRGLINPDFTNHVADYYYSMGVMLGKLYSGVPVYDELGKYLRSCGGKFDKRMAYESWSVREAMEKGGDSINKNVSILDVAMVNGFTIAELEGLRSYFNNNTLTIPGCLSGARKPLRSVKMPNFNKACIKNLNFDIPTQYHEIRDTIRSGYDRFMHVRR